MLNGVVWGDGGKLTSAEDRAARRRALAQQLARGADTSPVAHWTQGAARVLNSLADVTEERRLSKEQEEADKSGMASLTGLMGGGGFPAMAAVGGAPVATGSATGSAAVSGNVGKGPAAFQEIGPRIKSDLMRDFGLAPEQAAGIVGNLAHESGGFGTLQEIKPMIPGSRGGFGYAQWTGPRRRQFESWAAENKLDPASYEANYGFLKHELANTGEGRVLDRIRQTNDPTQATRIFSDVFLRPGIPGMGSREKWTQRALAFSQQPQMASNMPVVSPGNGAAPMPLARQQAETAQMPMAGPQSNEGLAQDGAGELQAGGSGMMAEPAVYRDQLNNVPTGDLMQRGPMPEIPADLDVSRLITPASQPSVAQGFAPSPDQAAPMAQEAGINPAASVAPSRDTGPLPPENAMPQQAPMMQPQRPMAMGFNPAMGGENGISPQMFADAEFAAREGRPVPGMMPQGQAQAAPTMSPVQSVAAAMPQGGPQMAAQAPEQPSAVQRVAGAMPPGDRLAQLATIAANPSISPQIRTVAATMWQKESERMNRDPRDSTLKDLQIRKAERDLKDRPNTEIIRDPNTGEVLAIDKNNPGAGAQVIRPGGPSSQAPTTRTIKQPDGSEVAVQWNPQSKAWEPMAAPQGGNAVRAPAKLTEQQSKDLVYYNRGIQALETMGDGAALTGGQGLVGATVGQVPVLGNYAKSEAYQMAEQAGRNFLNSILRKDTGAAITTDEMNNYGSVFLPQPGNSAELIKQKAEARKQAIDAIRDGLGPADVLALGQRLTRREDARTPAPDRPGNAAPQPSPAPAQGGFRVLKVE